MDFRPILLYALVLACVASGSDRVEGQRLNFRGEASVSGTLSDTSALEYGFLARYLPELSAALPLFGDLQLDFSASANLWATYTSSGDTGDRQEEGADPYRAWVRISAPRFEMRVGLQKISFGSANVFRPLMWFDRVDPRDPLQLTEGVWGILGRAYLAGNVTAWGWVVKGEDELKGWEGIPTEGNTAETGGRIQIPAGSGELAASYHHRRFDIGALDLYAPETFPPTGNEDRFALDGKWDLEVGLWFEAAMIRQVSEALEDGWLHSLSVGIDYTLGVGNGLTVLAEHLVRENPSFRLPEAPLNPGRQDLDSSADTVSGLPRQLQLSSFTANYPVGVLDRLVLAVYRDWESSAWFRLMEWRRTYDRWGIHLLAFWNPEGGSFFPSYQETSAASSPSLVGRGAQLIVVFNH